MKIEQLELFNKVRDILGLSERELINVTLTETIQRLVKVIENERSN